MRVFDAKRPNLPPFEMPARFKTDVVYFITPAGDSGVPKLPTGEYWVRLDDAKKWLDELVIDVVSPLDAASKAEVELTEEQEAWLEWMVANQVEHVRLET